MRKLLLFIAIFILLLTIAFAPPGPGYACTGCVNNVCVGVCNATANIATITPCYGDDICHVNYFSFFLYFCYI